VAGGSKTPGVRVRGNYIYAGFGSGLRWTLHTAIAGNAVGVSAIGGSVVVGSTYTYTGSELISMSKTRVAIDPNVRVRGNGTYAGFEDVTGPIEVNEQVEVYEPESGLTGDGQVTEIDAERRLVYLSVNWASLTEADDPRPAAPGGILYISANTIGEDDWLGLSAAPSLAYVNIATYTMNVIAPVGPWWDEAGSSWPLSGKPQIFQPYAELRTDRVVAA
jgi:hypothetical protein